MGEINIRKIFGENVRFYRKERGLSQEQLAEKLEISINHLSIIETGKQFVTYNLLEKIVELFGVSPSALFYTESLAKIDESMQNRINALFSLELNETQKRLQEKLQEWR